MLFLGLNSQEKVVLSLLFYGAISFVFIRSFWPFAQKIFVPKFRLNPHKSAEIIGTYFTEISDRLVNTIELELESDQDSNTLRAAAIQQKLAFLEDFNFKLAVNSKPLFRAAWICGITCIFCGVFYFVNPRLAVIGSEQVVSFGQLSSTNNPVQFIWNNDLCKSLSQ